MQFGKHIKPFAALMMVLMLGVGGITGIAAATSDATGTVTDSNGNAVADATVEAVNSSGTVVASATTSSDGSYSLTGLSDSTDYTLQVSATGYTDASKSFSTGSGTSETVDVTLTPQTYTVDGTVTDSDGNPVENITVTVTDADGVEIGTATTDSKGQYSIAGVPHGTNYTVEASADGLDTASKTVDVTSASTVDFSLSLSDSGGGVIGIGGSGGGSSALLAVGVAAGAYLLLRD
ncbi:carboxypeptidase-like regulatory domain-containing protein [Natronomonas marina]|uniref:carboxypeptidase-like regulatory domain-containing protein n=1 Tax=Natronomonas marina TaxID=2961939 RepID=UPI0020C9E7A8|nr:carboxypeptidase-like regulatory domain-containing protein [Natronomonas marina]